MRKPTSFRPAQVLSPSPEQHPGFTRLPSRTRNVSAAGRVTFFWMYFRWTSIEGCPQAPCQFWNTWAWQSMIIQDTRLRTGLR